MLNCINFFYSLFYEPREFYTNVDKLMQLDKGGVAVATGWKVTKIDATNKIAVLDDGYEIKYDKCLIATGKFFLYPIKRKKKKNSNNRF